VTSTNVTLAGILFDDLASLLSRRLARPSSKHRGKPGRKSSQPEGLALDVVRDNIIKGFAQVVTHLGKPVRDGAVGGNDGVELIGGKLVEKGVREG
jgi:hypothetical protein